MVSDDDPMLVDSLLGLKSGYIYEGIVKNVYIFAKGLNIATKFSFITHHNMVSDDDPVLAR